jgi:polysaccharide deacetylase family protein (PEP-CTERM system associated)
MRRKGDVNMRLANALTVDVEDYFHVSALAGSIHRDTWDSRESRVERNTQRLLTLFEHAGVHATFFVLGWVAKRYPQLVRDIAASGHEIACHGFSHQLVYEQSQDQFLKETIQTKALLEDIGYPRLAEGPSSNGHWRRRMSLASGFP